jgi:hypothetical protein
LLGVAIELEKVEGGPEVGLCFGDGNVGDGETLVKL